MTERVIQPLSEPAAPTPEELAAGVAKAETFLKDVAPHLGRLFGVDLNIKIGDNWATVMEPDIDVVTADPRFFIEKGYTPDMASYATLHEVAAHLREKVTEPRLTDRVTSFMSKGKPQAIFHNVFADVAGNNLIHATLPRMRSVAALMYDEKLIAENDLTDQPRHMQFLYKVLKQEMVPDSDMKVLPEVDETIAGLRDYQNKGDLIKYSTAVAKSARQAMGGDERFDIWTKIIYPEYEKLLEQDRQDPERQDGGNSQDQNNEGSEQGESQGQPQQGEGDTQQPDGANEQNPDNQQQSGEGEGQPKDGDSQSDASGQPQSGQQSDEQRFGSYYQDYSENRHPDPMSHEDSDQLHQHAKERSREASKANSPRATEIDHEQRMEAKVREETGHSLQEQRQYDAEILKWRTSIDEMRDVFQQVINERVDQKRGLSRRSFSEGAVLNPDRLVQTFIDVRNNVPDPEAFRDYETTKGETEAIGKTDYVFLLDVSGSMDGEKAQAAVASTVIGLEGLAALQRDVEEAEAAHNIDLDLDIRTAIYTFGDTATCVKPLSTSVTPKERLDTYADVAHPNGGATQDFLALEEIEGLGVDSDRRRIIIAISDGGSNDGGGRDTSPRARRSIDKLRGQGWFVYGISIGSDDAERLYQPTARRVDDPSKLPQTIESFIEATIS